MDRYYGTNTDLTIALHRRLYLNIIMERYEGTHTTLTIAFSRGRHLSIIMDGHEGPLTSQNIYLINYGLIYWLYRGL
jgi:hypothetical protein